MLDARLEEGKDKLNENLNKKTTRKEAIKKMGKYAIYTAPIMIGLLTPTQKAQGASI